MVQSLVDRIPDLNGTIEKMEMEGNLPIDQMDEKSDILTFVHEMANKNTRKTKSDIFLLTKYMLTQNEKRHQRSFTLTNLTLFWLDIT